MKKLSMIEWEKEYIVGQIARFDEKNTMGSREEWDNTIKERMKDLPAMPEVQDIPGFTLLDWAMRFGPRNLIGILQLLNISKPNPIASFVPIPAALNSLNLSIKLPTGAKLDVSSPQRITSQIKKVAVSFGADLVGVCKLDRRWVYSDTYELGNISNKHKPQDITDNYQYVIVIGCGGGYGLRRYFPTYINTWTTNGYRQILAAALLSLFIRHIGFKAIDCTFDDVSLSIPQAMQAGLGQLGRNGLLITPQYGSSVRLGQIITNLPLITDTPIDFGVTEFCNVCKKCANSCPSHSITHAKRSSEPINISNSENELKWQFNAETCHINLYGYKKPCQICISVCPFTKPNTLFHNTIRWFVDNIRWADAFYNKMDNVFGYTKPKNADNFWEKWQPNKY